MRKFTPRRIIVLFIGGILIGLGIAVYKTATMGSDPHSALMFSIASKLNSTFSTCFFVASGIYFVFELLFAKDLINIGTAFNWLCTGYFTDFFLSYLSKWFADGTPFLIRLIILLAGLLIISLGVSMYQTADLGVGPYDSLAIILDRKLPKLKYFWCRIIVDGSCALIAMLMGGITAKLIGIGTIIAAFGFGPFISFFNRFSEKLVKTELKE